MATKPNKQISTRQRQTLQFWALVKTAGALLKKDLRSPEDVERLVQALQAFKDSADNISPLPQKGATNQVIFSTPIIAFSPQEKEVLWFKKRGLRLIGELYYVHVRACRKKPTLIERFRALIEARYGLPTNSNPLACGWRPPYWDDPGFLAMLNTPIIEAFGQETKQDDDYHHHLKSRSRHAAQNPNSYHVVMPRSFTSARSLHLSDQHHVGSMLQRTQEDLMLNASELELRQRNVHLLETAWGGALVPPEWTPPSDIPLSWRREARIVNAEQRVYEEALIEYRSNRSSDLIHSPLSLTPFAIPLAPFARPSENTDLWEVETATSSIERQRAEFLSPEESLGIYTAVQQMAKKRKDRRRK